MGEPLVHPQFNQFIGVCRQKKVKVNLTTNGTLLNSENTLSLLDPIVSQVNFSLQSFDSNFPGKNNKIYLEKIFYFAEQALLQRPDLYLNFRLWNLGSENEINNTAIIDKIEKRFNVSVNKKTDVRRKKSIKVKERIYLHFDSRFKWPNPYDPIRSESGFCHGLSSHIGVLADGTIVPCCLDKEGNIALGNCTQSKIENIVDSERPKLMVQGFAQGKLVEDFCQRCTFISRFDSKLKKLGNRCVNPSDIVVIT